LSQGTAARTGESPGRRIAPARLVLVAFLFHAPGLWLLGAPALGRRTRRENLAAVLATIIAMALAGALTRAVWPVVVAWAVGHAAWGARLAARVRRGVAADP
jgi:hypothetical protein